MDEPPIFNPFDEEDKRAGRDPFDDNYTSGRSLVWMLLGVIVLGCGVSLIAALLYFKPDTTSLYAHYFPSPTPTPSPTATRTPTNTPTPTPNFTATAQAMQATGTAVAYQAIAENAAATWKVVRSDTFDSNSSKWPVEPSDDEYALIGYEITDGKYRWDATAHKSFISWVRSSTRPLNNFYVSVDVQQMEGEDTADYGLIFRQDALGNFYYFGISKRGQYVVYKFFEEWETLVSWTKTDLIRPGEKNRLTVLGEGSHFTFFINDQFLTETTDDTIVIGQAALAIEMTAADDHAIVEFDNLVLRAP